jgi:hypothetical protein
MVLSSFLFLLLLLLLLPFFSFFSFSFFFFFFDGRARAPPLAHPRVQNASIGEFRRPAPRGARHAPELCPATVGTVSLSTKPRGFGNRLCQPALQLLDLLLAGASALGSGRSSSVSLIRSPRQRD